MRDDALQQHLEIVQQIRGCCLVVLVLRVGSKVPVCSPAAVARNKTREEVAKNDEPKLHLFEQWVLLTQRLFIIDVIVYNVALNISEPHKDGSLHHGEENPKTNNLSALPLDQRIIFNMPDLPDHPHQDKQENPIDEDVNSGVANSEVNVLKIGVEH